MTRIKISVFILAAMITASIISGVRINRSCTELLGQIEAMRSYSAEKSYEKAKTAAEEYFENWDEFRKSASVMVKSDKLSEIDRIGSRILYLIEAESDELDAELAELEGMLELLRDGEKPILRSIF